MGDFYQKSLFVLVADAITIEDEGAIFLIVILKKRE